MKTSFFPLLILLIHNSFLPSKTEEELSTLQSVQIIFRHGDRGPVESAKTIESPLTSLGKKQMHDLGIYCRQRYPNLVKEKFDSEEVFFLSSDRGRTLESSLLFARGFYQDSNLRNSWSGGKLAYDPVPVKSSPPKYDMLFLRNKVCPRFEEIMADIRIRFVSNFRDRNPELIRDYETHTGKTFDGSSGDISSEISNFLVFQDEVFINISHNEPILDWIQPYVNNMDFISAQLAMETAKLETDEHMRLYAGPLAKVIMDNFATLEKKMVVYGGHDRNVYCLLEIFGIWDDNNVVFPPIASFLIIELHQNSTGQFLEFWYRNNTQSDPMLLEVPNCGRQCEFSKLQTLMAKFIPSDIISECQIPVL